MVSGRADILKFRRGQQEVFGVEGAVFDAADGDISTAFTCIARSDPLLASLLPMS